LIAEQSMRTVVRRRPTSEEGEMTTPSRETLHARLAEVLGREHAETLMRYLRFVTSDDLATRSDVDRLETRLDQVEAILRGIDERLSRIEERLDRIDDRILTTARTYMTTTIASVVTLSAAMITSQVLF
jgi:hypothetical protein